jgi:protein-S-isoprenylcysteine O-methyltransferase Ste14
MILIGMPEVTVDRFLLLIGMGAWILLVAPFEERDAELQFGEGYAAYKTRTPRWLPRLRLGEKE